MTEHCGNDQRRTFHRAPHAENANRKDRVTMSTGEIVIVVTLLAGSLLMAGLVEEAEA